MIQKRQNFIGSHIFWRRYRNLGEMYVTFSYGNIFQYILWYKNKWYKNDDYYFKKDGSINYATEQHKKDMEPTEKTIKNICKKMKDVIKAFMKKII